MKKIEVHPGTRKALSALIGHALERVLTTGDPMALRAMSEDAKELRVSSADGRSYSGVVLIHDNVVTDGVVAPKLDEPTALTAESDSSVAELLPVEATCPR